MFTCINQSCGTQWQLSDVVIKDEGQGPLFRCALCGARNCIQAASLPIALAGHDLIAQAKTGSGKTATFALALLARLDALRKLKAGTMKGEKVRVRLMDE